MKRLKRWLQLSSIGLLVALAASGCKKVAPEKVQDSHSQGYLATTFAGSGGRIGGYSEGTGTLSAFNNLDGIAIDAAGNIYVCDQYNYRVRKVTPEGVVTTLAGNGSYGYSDGIGKDAQFSSLQGMTIDPSGNLYVADYDNSVIRKITPAGVVSTYAGNGHRGQVDGPVATAEFDLPTGLAIDKAGNLFVGDSNSYTIRKISTGGVVSTYAGVPYTVARTPPPYEGPANQLKLGLYVNGMTVNVDGNLYIADQINNYIYKITPDGNVSTFAGDGQVLAPPVFTFRDGFGPTAEFSSPIGVSNDAEGNLYVAELFNQRIRKITPDRVVSTVVGNGTAGEVTGIDPKAAQVSNPYAIVSTSDGTIYFTEINRIVKVESADRLIKPSPNTWNNPQTWENPH